MINLRDRFLARLEGGVELDQDVIEKYRKYLVSITPLPGLSLCKFTYGENDKQYESTYKAYNPCTTVNEIIERLIQPTIFMVLKDKHQMLSWIKWLKNNQCNDVSQLYRDLSLKEICPTDVEGKYYLDFGMNMEGQDVDIQTLLYKFADSYTRLDPLREYISYCIKSIGQFIVDLSDKSVAEGQQVPLPEDKWLELFESCKPSDDIKLLILSHPFVKHLFIMYIHVFFQQFKLESVESLVIKLMYGRVFEYYPPDNIIEKHELPTLTI